MAIIVLENVSTGKKMKLVSASISYTRSNVVSAFPLPEMDENQTNIIKLEGVESKIRIEATLVEGQAGEDFSMGTSASPVRSLWEQIEWLKQFVTPNVAQTHRVTVMEGATVLFQRDGVFTSFDVSYEAGRPNVASLSVEFVVGLVI